MAKLYVAYGSNLNKEQMRYRCPAAKFVGTGIIEGYECKGLRNAGQGKKARCGSVRVQRCRY